MEKRVVLINGLIHLVLAVISFILISFVPDTYPVLRGVLFMVWGALCLVALLRLWSLNPQHEPGSMIILMWTGGALLLLFFIWALNTVFKLCNTLLDALNLDYVIGNLFGGVYQVLFSWPALLIGVALVAIAINFDGLGHYRLWRFLFLYWPSQKKEVPNA